MAMTFIFSPEAQNGALYCTAGHRIKDCFANLLLSLKFKVFLLAAPLSNSRIKMELPKGVV